MKRSIRCALSCFLLSFFAYFRFLLVAAAVLLIGSFFYHPLLYVGILALVLDLIFSISMTVQVAMVTPTNNEDFVFQQNN